MQETKPCKTRERLARNARTFVNGRSVFLSLKTGSVKFLRLSNVDKVISEVDRGFMFCESSFLGVQKLQEG